MNFKILIALLVLFLSGCGVKSKPLTPPETAIQSYVDSYISPADKDKKSLPAPPEKKK